MIRNNDNTIVVSENTLFEGNTPFYGFRSSESVDYKDKILKGHESRKHGEESYFSGLKHIVVCYFIVNPEKRLISAYKRNTGSKKCRDPDAIIDELSIGDWSCSYRNHLKSIDTKLVDPLAESGLAKLKKGIDMDGELLDARLLGYIHGTASKSADIANMSEQERIIQAHFTVVYALRTNAEEVVKKDALASKMITISDLGRRIYFSEKEGSCSEFDLSTRQSIYALNNYINTFHPDDDVA